MRNFIDPSQHLLTARSGAAPVERLEQTRRNLEEKFLAGGEILSQSIKGLETLIASLEKLAGTLSSDIVEVTTAELEAAATRLFALPQSHASRMRDIDTLSTCRKNLAMPITEMRNHLAYMRAFTVNIKIVAGGLGDAGDEFSIFAQDIAECIARGTTELENLEADAVLLQNSLEAAAAQGTLLGRRIGKLLPALPQDLIRSAKAMSAHYRSVAETASRVTELARDIRKRVARILVAQQIGDITRQRIEHIQHGLVLAQAGELLREHPAKEQISSYIYALEAELLRSTLADFDRETSEINKSMDAMADSARALLQLHEMAFTSGCDGKDGFLHTLGSRIVEALELVETIEKNDLEANATGRDTAEAAGRLTQRVQAIQLLKNDVQYMALNTTLKCCQIGDVGRPLSVVAIELKEHATKLDTAATQFLSELQILVASSEVLSGGQNGDGVAQSESQVAAKALKLAAERVHRAGEQTEADITVIADKGDTVLKTLELSAQRLNFQQDITCILSDVADELQELGQITGTCPPEIAQALRQILADLNKDYTMAQERDIQQTFIETWAIGSDTVADNSADPQNDFDAILF